MPTDVGLVGVDDRTPPCSRTRHSSSFFICSSTTDCDDTRAVHMVSGAYRAHVAMQVKGLCGLQASCGILTSVYGIRGVRTLMDLMLAMALLEVVKCQV